MSVFVPRETYFGGRARLMQLPASVDHRGKLLPIPFEEMPFVPRRCFCISQVPEGTERGNHAHKVGFQMLLCLNGRIEVMMRDGKSEVRVCLADDSSSLLIGPLIWTRQTYLTAGAVLMVIASHDYDPASYVVDTGDLA